MAEYDVEITFRIRITNDDETADEIKTELLQIGPWWLLNNMDQPSYVSVRPAGKLPKGAEKFIRRILDEENIVASSGGDTLRLPFWVRGNKVWISGPVHWRVSRRLSRRGIVYDRPQVRNLDPSSKDDACVYEGTADGYLEIGNKMWGPT